MNSRLRKVSPAQFSLSAFSSFPDPSSKIPADNVGLFYLFARIILRPRWMHKMHGRHKAGGQAGQCSPNSKNFPWENSGVKTRVWGACLCRLAPLTSQGSSCAQNSSHEFHPNEACGGRGWAWGLVDGNRYWFKGDVDVCRCVVPCEVCQKSGSVQNEGPTWEAGADDDDDGHDNDYQWP